MISTVPEPIKVLIVDDDARIRSGLTEIFQRTDDIKVVGEAGNGEAAVIEARKLHPDVVLMDLHMPRRNGLQATNQLQQEMPEVKVLIFTVSDKEANLLRSVKAGARGYLLKNEEPALIIEAVHYVFNGGTIVSVAMAAKLASDLGELEGFETRPPPRAPDVPAPPSEAPSAAQDDDLPTVEAPPDAEPEGVETDGAPDPDAPVVMRPAVAPELPARDVELIVPPPLDPTSMLRLQTWLKEIGMTAIDEITPSWDNDTTMKMTFSPPVPLLSMLAESPFVIAASEELGEAPNPELRRLRVILATA